MASLLNWMGIDIDYVNSLVLSDAPTHPSALEGSIKEEQKDYRTPIESHGVMLMLTGAVKVDTIVMYQFTYSIETEEKKMMNGSFEQRFSNLQSFHDTLSHSFHALPIFPRKTLFASTSDSFIQDRMVSLYTYFHKLLARVDVMKAGALSTLFRVDKNLLIQASNSNNIVQSAEIRCFNKQYVMNASKLREFLTLRFDDNYTIVSVIEIEPYVFAVAIGDQSMLSQVDTFLDEVMTDLAYNEPNIREPRLGDEEKNKNKDIKHKDQIKYGSVFIFDADITKNIFHRKKTLLFDAPCQFMRHDDITGMLYVANSDGIIYVVSNENELVITHTFPLFHDPFTCLEFIPESHKESIHEEDMSSYDSKKIGGFFLACSEEGTIKAVNVANKALVFTYHYPEAQISALAYDAVRQRLFIGTCDRFILIFSCARCFVMKLVSTSMKKKIQENSSAAEYVIPEVVEDIPSNIIRKQANTPQFLHKLYGHDGSIRKLIFDDENNRLLSCSFDGFVLAWTIAGMNQEYDSRIEKILTISDSTVDAMYLSSDRNILIAGNQAGTIAVWDIAKDCVLFAVKAHQGKVNYIDITRDNCIISTSEDGSCRVLKFLDNK